MTEQAYHNHDNFPQQPNETGKDTRYYTGIDWGALFLVLLENIHWILIAAFVCAAATGLYVRSYVTPIYQATSKIYIAGSEATISLSDIQLGSSLAADYQEAFHIWHVHEMVDEKLGLNYSYSKLGGMVSVYSPSGSHILYINVQSPDPEEAKLLADTYAEVVQDFIDEKMDLRRPQLIQVAQLPTSPISPNLKSSVIKAFAVGGLLAAAVIVFLHLLDDKIRTGDDVEKATGLPTLGVLMKQTPKKEAFDQTNFARPANARNYAEIQGSLALDYTGSESVNAICSAIMFAGKNMKRIAVTSHEADNGKTFLAVRIAKSMADRGKKALLIDGDLRKNSITGQYRVKHTSAGLAHLLSGQCALEDAVYQTNIPNLFLMPAGAVIQAPLPLLTAPDFELLMDHLEGIFDFVIVDTPPVGIVIDAAEIAKRCDGSLLVLEYNKQTKGALRYMHRLLEQTQTPVIGCVINKVVMKKLSQKRYYYHYGSYDSYGKSDRAKKRSFFKSKGQSK